MHIELTDILRCPREHEEAFVVLLPEQMNGRRVAAGVLACPICDWRTGWSDGIPDFGDAWESSGSAPIPPEAIVPMLGLEGAGGWIALAGSASLLADELTTLLPGVGIITINPPRSRTATEAIQVLRSGAWPIKQHSLRGAILGADASRWRDEALAALLSGRHLIGVGELPAGKAEVLGHVEDVWIVKR